MIKALFSIPEFIAFAILSFCDWVWDSKEFNSAAQEVINKIISQSNNK